MNCVYTYDNRTFNNKSDLVAYLDDKKQKVKNMYQDYLSRSEAKGETPTMEGFTQFFNERDGLPQFKSANKLFTVQQGNLNAIKSGQKTLSFRTAKDRKLYEVGDILDIQVGKRSANLRVQITKIHDIKEFPNISRDRKDKMAEMLGSYKSFEDMIKVNDYLNPSSWVSKQFPTFSKFLRGETEGAFIEYVVVDRTLEDVKQDALTSNPALTPYKYLLETVITEIDKQIRLLERKDLKNKSFKENRLTRLKKIFDDAVASQDLLVLTAQTLEDLRTNEKALQTLLENDQLEDEIKLSRLASFRMLTESYSFLDDIEAEMEEVIKGSTDSTINPTEAFKELEEAVKIKKRIENSYLKEIEPIIARKLLPYASSNAVKELEKELEFKIKKHQELKNKVNKDDSLSEEQKAKRLERSNRDINRIERAIARGGHNEESIIALMRVSEKDIDFFEKWLGAPEQSSDPITAMFSLNVKKEMEFARRKTMDTVSDIQMVYDEFAKEHADMSLDQMYGDLVEVYKSSTETRGEERLRFVDKYDKEKFNKARNKYLKSIDFAEERSKFTTELQEIKTRAKLKKSKKGDVKRKSQLEYLLGDPFNKRIKQHYSYKWYRENTKNLPDEQIKAKVKEKLASLGSGGIIEWAEDNMNLAAMQKWGLLPNPTEDQKKKLKYNPEPDYKGDLRVYTDKYLNDNWLKLYSKDGKPKNKKGELHKVLTEKYLKAQKKIPEHRRQGLILPGIYKYTKDRLIEGQGIKGTVKKKIQELKENYTGNLAEDIEFGESDSLGNMVSNIPTYYFNTLAPEDTSIDVVQSVLQYVKMADVYQARANSLDTGMFLIDKLKKRKVGTQNSFFRNKYDNAARRLGFKIQLTKDKEDDNSSERLRKFVEMVIFGHSSKELRLGNVRLDKVIDSFMAYASFSSFALPVDAGAKLFMGATSNFNQQLAQQFIEASGKDSDLDPKVLLKGYKLAAEHAHDYLLKDFGKSGQKTLIGQILDRYDVMQGNYLDTLGNKISGTKLRKLINTDTLYFHRHLSEYEPQVALLLGTLDNKKVKQGDKEISLLEAYELDEKGNIRLKKDVEWSSDEEFKLMTRLHGLSKTLNGVYNSFSKPVLEQHALGRSLAFFRKYLYPSLRRRWSSERIDYEQDKFERGYALSFWRAMHRDLFVYKENISDVLLGKTFSDKEKQERVKTMVSFSIGLGMMALSAVLKMAIDSDDEDDDTVLNYLLYNTIRMQSETWSFWNPQEFMRILRSPTILTTYLERVTRFTTQLMFDPTGEYERASGVYEKGDSKLYARFIKMLLGQTSYSLNPEIAVKNFENLIN